MLDGMKGWVEGEQESLGLLVPTKRPTLHAPHQPPSHTFWSFLGVVRACGD